MKLILMVTSCAPVNEEQSKDREVVRVGPGLYRVIDTLPSGTVVACYYDPNNSTRPSCLDDPATWPAQ